MQLVDIDLDARRPPDSRGKMTIATVEGPHVVDATFYGDFALHAHIPYRGDPEPIPAVTLTHVKTGLAMLNIEVCDGRLTEAVGVMETLIAAIEALGLDWNLTDITAMPSADRMAAQVLVSGFVPIFNFMSERGAE